jgi:hypothetical protein
MATELAHSTIPIPDPTLLTTEALRREVSMLRELIEAKLAASDEMRALHVETLKSVPAQIEAAMAHLREVEAIKVAALERRFTDADTRYAERFDAADLRYQQRYDASDKALMAASLAAQGAVNAALAAAKEAVQAASLSAEKSVAAQNDSNAAAVTKSETAVTKQIDGILALLGSSATAMNDKFAAINGRLDRGEGINSGGQSFRSERRLDVGMVVGLAALGMMAITLFLSLSGIVGQHAAPAQVGAAYPSSYYQPQSQSPAQFSVVPAVPMPVPQH